MRLNGDFTSSAAVRQCRGIESSTRCFNARSGRGGDISVVMQNLQRVVGVMMGVGTHGKFGTEWTWVAELVVQR